jgi:hypothetical protein
MLTKNVPIPAKTKPTMPSQFCFSPRKIQARTAIWISIVLLMMFDSIAVKTRKVWFQSKNAKAEFESPKKSKTPQERAEIVGKP